MKKAKKLLSLILAVLMLYSGMSVGLGGLVSFAAAGGSVTVAGASSTTYNRVDDVIICVPETIYMSPTTGASVSGQYFVNNIVDSSGKVTLDTSAADTTGQISIYAPGATAFSLDVTAAVGGIGEPVIGGSASDANNSYEGTTWAFSNFGSASDYASFDGLQLFINGTGVSMGSTASIKWAVTLTYSTGTVTYYVYSTLYTPHLSVGAVSESRRSGTYNNEISSWISGGNGSPNGTWSPITSGGGDKTTQGYFKYDPLWNALNTSGSSESSDDYVTASSNDAWKFVEAKGTSGSDGSRAVGYLGYLTIDSSRYSNINQIPNLKIGSDALRVNSSKKDSLEKYYAWYIIGDASNTIGSGYTDTPSGWTQFVSKSEPATTSRDTIVPSYSVSSINGKYIHTANQGYCTYLSSKNYANACASVLCSTVDKSALRKLVLQCGSLNYANYAYGLDWFKIDYENAAYVLGNPSASQSAVDTAVTRLNYSINGCTAGQHPADSTWACPGLQIDVNFNGNGGSVSAATQRVTIGTATTVSVTPPTATRTGYTFKGWATSASATSGVNASSISVSLYSRNLYAIWEANTYNLLFDNLFDFKQNKNYIANSYVTVDELTDTGFKITALQKDGADHNDCTTQFGYKIAVKPNTTYVFYADVSHVAAGSHGYEIFANVMNSSYAHLSDNTVVSDCKLEGGYVKGSNTNTFTFTTSPSAAYVNFRFDVNNTGSVMTVNNIRFYEAGTVPAGVSYHASQSVTYDSTYGTLPTPTRPGYQFGGWYDANGTGYWAADKVIITSDTSLYSKWTPNNYIVTFEKNLGDGTSVQTNYTPDDSVTVPSLTRTGYTLTGWNVTTADGNWSGSYNAGDVLTGMYGSPILQAQWALANYTITYNANGGSCSESTKSYTINDTVTLPTPTRTGYTFLGWTVSKTDGNWSGSNLTGSVSSKYGAVTLTAQWQAIPYAITFVDWDGDVLKQTDVDYDSTPTPPADPTRNADNGYTYTFNGWNPSVVTVTGAATYTATYKATLIPYTITLDAGEGSVSTTTIDYNYESTSYTLPTPTRTGYTFTGWSVKESVGSWSAGEAADGTLSNAYGNVTLVANYTPNQYTVTFDPNGGTIADGYSSTFNATYDSAIGTVLTADEIDRTGYTFTGWNTKADGTGDSVVAGQTWKYTDVTTVYAQWDAIEYTLSFINRDITNNKQNFVTPPEDITYTIEDDLSTLLPDTTVEGYDFNYWIIPNTAVRVEGSWKKNVQYATADLTTGNYGDVTLYMYYTAKSYTITWVNYDGTVLETDTAYYSSTPSYDGATPTKAPDAVYSYTFEGWDPAVATVTGDATYTATYSQKDREYTVKFVDWDGDVISEQSLHYGDAPVVPADPTRESTAEFTYTFAGWTPTVANVTADATYTADYTALTRSYTITWIVDGVESTTTVKYGETPDYGSTPTKDKTAEYTYTFAGWSPSIATVTGEATYTAQFSSTKNTYTVKFVDEDGSTVLDTQVLEYGETPVYAGETPTKAADVQYTYTFAGWNPTIDTVTGEATYTAKYDKTVNEYTITFVDEDGTTVLQSGDWKYGDTPVYSGATPTKAATAQYTYTFDGWTPAIAKVTGDATYTVKYKATTNKYTITFIDEDGTELQSGEVEYGTKPTAPADPTKTGDVQYSYTFAGWTPEIVNVTGDATYKATYTQSVNKYTIKFVNYDGTVIQSEDVEYGTVPAVPATNPTRAADAQYTYTFAGWDNTVVAVTGAATYTATYTSTVNKYKVTFVNWDDSVLATYTLDYGTMPTAPADPTRDATAEWTYTFDKWDKELATVTGDITYKATYVATKNTYMITFVDDDGTELQSGLVAYGATPTAPANPTKAADAQYTYTFAGWTPAVEAVTGEATYTATYDSTINQYTVTFYNEDGTTVLDTQTLDYGSALEYKGTTPTKAPVDGVEYAFSGWAATQGSEDVIALPNVTGNASYYAVYIATNIELDVTIIEEDGTTTTTKVKYGTYASELTFDNNQTKAQDAQYTYTFIGWNVIEGSETALDLETYKITANTTFYPAYSKTVREYTITFYDENGTTVLKSEDVAYGTVPTAPADPTKTGNAQYSYTFAGWTPEVVAVTGEATYTATYTESVNKYTVKFVDDDGSILKTENVEYGTVPTAPANPTKAATAQYTYTFDKWSPAIVAVTGEATYTATYTATVNEYNIKFVDENGTVLQESNVAYGETPAYTGETPTKTGDAQYSYTFKEWSPAIKAVDGVATYTATYTQTVNEYTIKFVNEDGTELQSSEVPYGTVPVYTGATPTKAATAQYTYTFASWDNEIVAVTGEATYTATFSSTVNKYVIEFVNDNGAVLQSSEVAYGDTPVYTGATPTKTATAQYTYTFKDWDNEIVSVTGAATYTATYTATVNKYVITFKNEDGTVLQQSEWEYGSTPAYSGETPTKAGTAKYSYTFKDWGTIEEVTEAAIYVAKYTETINKYTITFVNEDGTVLQSSDVEYDAKPSYTGATPEKAATAQYTYTFDKWSPEVVTVTGDATYTATYTSTVNEYTITWITGSGTFTGEWKYGSTPVPATDGVDTSKASTVSTDFTFAGWDVEIAEVTGTATYTALYTETTRKYTITWVVDGVSTDVDVEYGTVPVYEGTPTKASTAQYDYTFASWDVTPVAVVGEATYTAIFAETVRKYTITWITGSGEYTGSWEYGSTPDPVVDNVDTSKAPTPEAEYSFTGWNKTIVTVTGEATYIAQYDEAIRSYTVTYVVDGEVLEEQTVQFGSSFTHPAIPAKEGYSSHWDVAFMTMPAQDITVTAVYTAKKYTVTWVADGVTVYEEQVAFTSAIPVKAVPVKVGNTGIWDVVPETMPAQNIVITAVYTPNNYSVSWNFTYGSGTDVATYGIDYEVTFNAAILPVYIRVTVGGVVLSDEYYVYDNETGELFVVGTAITGAISISERAAEGYQNVVIAVANATLSNSSSIVAEGQSYHTQIVPAPGYLLPEDVTVYINGVELYEGYTYDANTGKLTVNAEVMTGELTISVDCPVNPNYDPTVKDCDCNCHGNSFVRFFFKIITFLRKLFGMTQYQYCDCGDAHW